MDTIRTPISNMLRRSRALSLVIVLLLVLLVGIADYFSGYQIYWSVFYLVAISVAVWNVGLLFAVLVAALSIISWMVGDWAAGVLYSNRFVPLWNAIITFGSYLIVIQLLTSLKSFHQTLEGRIREQIGRAHV